MDVLELKKEQFKLAGKISLNDTFSKVKTIGGISCLQFGNQLMASVTVCEFPSLKLIENKTYLLDNPLPYKPGFLAYREMPAMIEAYNKLDEEPDILLVKGPGILHPRKIGIASHLGLALNVPTIGVQNKLMLGNIEKGKIILNNEVVGFEIKTKEHAKPIYVSPGHQVSLGTVLNLIPKIIIFPHKLPEPLHLAHKASRKITRKEEIKEDVY
ncbi:MAG: endonuclease V [Nanoarchaeota archaeon]|nr:endonuclease V [Nanoarchaeota archaeon]MBU1643617.1 endonuclease V [Nanoarchaeota archaeon]MBU1976823.1 endonuclease V [Nanoarchaeota archaeon]